MPGELTCEYATNPIGLGTLRPRLSWVLESPLRGQMQTAYQILVAGSKEKLDESIGDKWDSGKVDSGESTHIEYAGPAPASGEGCYWKVRIWDQDGQPSGYSAPASFEMGLLQPGDWQGSWIGAETGISGPLLRTEFDLQREIDRARVYICGLGFYELYINGQKVGDHVLDPASVDYDKRMLYVPHDITGLLKVGRNTVGVILGDGWYCERPDFKVLKRRTIGNRYGDSPRVLMQLNLRFCDGGVLSVATDESWKTSSGPIVKNSLYGGETYDARLEKSGWKVTGYDDSHWPRATLKDPPGGALEPQLMPAIKVMRTLRPVGLSNPQTGVFVYDFGQLFGGWVRLHVKGPAGRKVTIKYSARLSKETGLIDMRRHPSPKETDFYMLKGGSGEVFEPRFTFHPVRYVQIEGYPGLPTEEDLEGRVVHSDTDLTGRFHCSNPLLNQIHKNVHWTLTNELFGLPLDCLHREHWAWTDPATITGTLYPRKHMPLFWTKWLRDILLAQDERGQIPDVAPNYLDPHAAGKKEPGEGRGDPAWGGNYPILVWYLYQYYGDRRLLEEHYDGAKRCVEFLGTQAVNDIVIKGHLGDHMIAGDRPGEEENVSSATPPPLVWTGYYYRAAAAVARAAEVLGNGMDAEKYRRLADRIAEAFNGKWLDGNSSRYATGSQTANAFALALGIVPADQRPRVVRDLVRTITKEYGGHLRTGNTGTTCLIDTLTADGHGEVMYGIATKESYPGWGYMVTEGATTIWESWSLQSKVGDAESMIMWATIDEFFYNDLAGIKGPEYYGPAGMEPGFRRIVIEPHPLGDLTKAGATFQTVRGPVSSEWERGTGSFSLDVVIPANARARIRIPKLGLNNIKITEGRQPVWLNCGFVGGVDGIVAGRDISELIEFEIGSGSYTFLMSGDPQ